MGILDLMLGNSGPGEQGVAAKSYTLPKDTHDFVYPVAVRREEVEAFAELLEAEADAPALEAEAADLDAAFEGLTGESGPDIDTDELAERMQQPRHAVEPVIESWRDTLKRDIGVVYARPNTDEALVAFVKLCKQRDEDEADAFELPENFPNAAALLKRLKEGTDTQYRAVVHTDLLPDK
ncbi:hypothetical protein [Natrinema versiforme]|uniref:Uncharacterized protein n=1 Tax=Natrinema versiforme JCM 10478 TaxID=1227496 RepID=L9YEQ0_9EURY|nr:hypothetical protein [Natrinema versiforme]ELY71423.1 hypothetical protein C489_00606 [Natrinema versiforme JCM 10478]